MRFTSSSEGGGPTLATLAAAPHGVDRRASLRPFAARLLGTRSLSEWYTPSSSARRTAGAPAPRHAGAGGVGGAEPSGLARRHLPMPRSSRIAVLIAAAARPQPTVAVPVTDAAIMLANDVRARWGPPTSAPHGSAPRRRPTRSSCATYPSSVEVGLIEFARRRPVLAVADDRPRARRSRRSRELHAGSGGTAIGDAIQTAMRDPRRPRGSTASAPPGAIVLISDGASNVGVEPDRGRSPGRGAAHPHLHDRARAPPRARSRSSAAARPSPSRCRSARRSCAQIAAASGGHARSPPPTAPSVSAVYAHLAEQLGHKTGQTRDHRELRRRRPGAAAASAASCRCAGSAASPRARATTEDR